MDISIEWSQYILGYKYVAMLQLHFEALVLFSFFHLSNPILLTGEDEFCSHFCWNPASTLFFINTKQM